MVRIITSAHHINDFFGKLNKSKAVANRLIINERLSGVVTLETNLLFIDIQANIEAMTAGVEGLESTSGCFLSSLISFWKGFRDQERQRRSF